MAATIGIDNVSVTGTTATVDMTIDVTEASQCQLHWQSVGGSEVNIPEDSATFQVPQGVTQESLPVNLNIPEGQTATVAFTANVTSPENATDQVQVDITNSGNGSGPGNGDGGLDRRTALILLAVVAAVIWWVTQG